MGVQVSVFDPWASLALSVESVAGMSNVWVDVRAREVGSAGRWPSEELT
jgi:hypothetical protein